MSTPSVKTATAQDEERAIAALVLAFAADPSTRWAWPDPAQYLTYFPRFVRAFGGRAFEHGTAYRTEDGAGVALWLPPGVSPDEEAVGAVFAESVPGPEQAAVFAVLDQMAHYHPDEPHWYLPLIGVDPVRQGQGYGSALLQHALRRCDVEHLPAYLESSNPANVPLYQRHGFEVVGKIQAGTSPTFYPMVRKSR
ncbi:MAG TPA: GNAT family N-acetyltransferase [Chloroflexota bacterium]|jgi:ribosomal protein S18 acetylase RimI-like enzyme